MATGVVSWSKTAATNATADSTVGMAEGMSPAAVNDGVRAAMASVAKYRDDTAGALTTAGTSTAYTLTSNQVFASLTAMDGAELSVLFNATNGAAPTLAVDGLTAKPIQVSTTVAVGTGVILINSVWSLTYNNSAGAFIMRGVPAKAQDGIVATSSIAASAVTYAKLQNETNNTLLGNVSGGSAAPEEITIGTGLTVAGTTLSVVLPAPMPGGFKNLSIKVATTTTVAVAADFVTTTDGTLYQTTALSGTINMGTNGAANALAGAEVIAAATWYAIWAIAKPDGTTAALASASFTAPVLPTGYTFKARIGAVQSLPAAATLYGTWQLGRRAQYVVGLAGTTAGSVLVMANGVANTYSATSPTLGTVSVTPWVPTTASHILVSATTLYKNGANTSVLVAPNTNWGGTNNGPAGSAGSVWPLWNNNSQYSSATPILLETTSIAWASAGTAGAISCLGWEDNI